ncbi:MAG: hypothetical protein ACE366_00800 [Bradymonadia bacterium]
MIVEVLWWALWVMLGGLALLIFMPWTWRVEGNLDDEGAWWHAHLTWGLGLLAIHAGSDGATLRVCGLRVVKLSGRGEQSQEKQKRPRKRRKGSKKRSRRGVRWFLAHRRTLLWCVKRYVKALHLSGCIEGEIGLPRPDQTAAVHRLLDALDARLPLGVLQVHVHWVEEVLALRSHLKGWMWPAQVLAITIALLFHSRTRRMLRAT